MNNEHRTIGILGGLGPGSTIEYYHYITDRYHQSSGDYGYPVILLYSFNFKEIIDKEYETPSEIVQAIKVLEGGGADFVIAACNSIHKVYDEVCKEITIPWVSIVDVTGEHIQAAGMEKVGLLGTVFTMKGGFYQSGLKGYGIEVITPEEGVQERVNEIIYSELVKGVFLDGSKAFLLDAIDHLVELGVGGVILGCTELPLILKQEDTEVPLFDTTRLHAQRALDIAIGKVPLDW